MTTPRPPDPVLAVIAALDGLLICPNGMYAVAGEFRCGAVGLRYDAGLDTTAIVHPSAACELALHPDSEAAADFAQYVKDELLAAVPLYGGYCEPDPVNELAMP